MSSTPASAPLSANVDTSKRTWLIASSCAGAVGAGFVAVPFVSSFSPSERAKAAGVESAVFDRNGLKYHGAAKELADAAREGGLKF